jgi:hypothetical protein
VRISSIFRRWLATPPFSSTTRLFLERLEERTTPVIHINGFDGITAAQGGNSEPPDSDGCVGPSSYIAQANATAIAIYNKSTGVPIAGPINVNNSTFFLPVRLSGSFAGDPVMAYNDITGRFGVGDEDFNHNVFYFAISTSSNPTTLTTASWNFFRYTVTQTGITTPDYPKIGYNADGFVVSFNQFGNSGFNHSAVLAIGNDGSSPGIQSIPGGAGVFTAAPASMHDASPGGPMWFTVAPMNSASSTIKVLRMDNVFTSSPTFTNTNLSVTSYGSTASPHEPAGQFTGNTNLGTRMYFAGERTVSGTDHLVAAHTVGDGSGFSRVQWYDIDVGGAGPTLIQQGRINPGANLDALFPDMDINSSGNIGMQYMLTGTNQIPTIAITGRAASDPAGTMDTPVLPHNTGNNINPRDRVGDYSMTSVDPTDGTFWGINEYGGPTGNPNWRTRVEHWSVAVPLDVQMTTTNNNLSIRNNPTNPANVQVFDLTTSTVLDEVAIASISSINVTGSTTTDALTVDYNFGDPLPSNGLSFQHTAGGTDTLNVDDQSTTTAQTFTLNANTIQRSGSAVITFSAGQISAVNVIGGSGNNLLDLSSFTSDLTDNVTGADSGNVVGVVSYVSVGSINAGSGSDRFVFSDGATLSGVLNGGSSGTNTLDSSAYTSTESYNINGVDAGSGTTVGSFTNIQTLIGGGGSANDFAFAPGGSLSASLNGGSGSGAILDYATNAWTDNVTVDLAIGAASGVAGLTAGAVSNIQSVMGANGGGAGFYNLLIGNGGATLQGGLGRRNILVAGGSASTLIGGDGEDLIIAGSTSYDTNPALTEWQAIAAYWTGSDPFATRVSNLLSGTGVPILDPTAGTGTVFGNGGGNTINGNGGVAAIFTDGADTISGFDPSSQMITIIP